MWLLYFSCNHRDFQNMGVNGEAVCSRCCVGAHTQTTGARSSSMNDTIKYGLARNKTADYPLLVFVALIGTWALSKSACVSCWSGSTKFTFDYFQSVIEIVGWSQAQATMCATDMRTQSPPWRRQLRCLPTLWAPSTTWFAQGHIDIFDHSSSDNVWTILCDLTWNILNANAIDI